MREETWFEKIIRKVFNLFVKEKDDEEIKREMCKRALDSGVCNKSCRNCAWNVIW